MRYITYTHERQTSWGVIDDGVVFDLSHSAPSLKDAIINNKLPDSMDDVSFAFRTSADGIEYLPPVPDPARILCAGQNYAAHRDEMGGETTEHPLIFTRFPSTVSGHEQRL